VVRLFRKTPIPLLVLALAPALAVSACSGGGGEKPDLATGKQLFTQKCGACHILNNAATKGTVGPNLDLAFAQDVRDGIGRSTIKGVVKGQIKLPQGDEMPAKLVEGKQAEDVSAYVADAIGKPAGAADAAAGPSGTAKANAQNVVEIPTDPTGQLAYKFKSATADAGKVTLESKNDASVPHDIGIKGGPKGKVVTGGGVSTATADLKAGSYTFYCSVPGHEQAGMKGTLTLK
jgi:mono/diheme cytochrome c family protein